jgi:DNA invertase Pin-like site-specific DNA recombinase
MVAEFESDLIRMRTREEMKIAKAKGHLRGRQPKLKPRQEAHLVALFDGGEYTTGELAELFGVGRSAVYRALTRSRGRTPASSTHAVALSSAGNHRADTRQVFFCTDRVLCRYD